MSTTTPPHSPRGGGEPPPGDPPVVTASGAHDDDDDGQDDAYQVLVASAGPRRGASAKRLIAAVLVALLAIAVPHLLGWNNEWVYGDKQERAIEVASVPIVAAPLHGKTELAEPEEKCQHPPEVFRHPEPLPLTHYQMPPSGVAILLALMGPDILPGSDLEKLFEGSVIIFEDELEQKCHVLNPFSDAFKHIVFEKASMESYTHAGIYQCLKTSPLARKKSGRATKLADSFWKRYATYADETKEITLEKGKCVIVAALDRMSHDDLEGVRKWLKNLPKTYAALKPLDYDTVTWDDAVEQEENTKVAFAFTNGLIPAVQGCKDCPFKGGSNLRGLEKALILNWMESIWQRKHGLTVGAMHEAFKAKGAPKLMRGKCDEIDTANINLWGELAKLLERLHTENQKYSEESLGGYEWVWEKGLESWPPTFAGTDSCFSKVDVGTNDLQPMDDDNASDGDDDNDERGEEGGDSKTPSSIDESGEWWTEVANDRIYQKRRSKAVCWLDSFEEAFDVSDAPKEMTCRQREVSEGNIRLTVGNLQQSTGVVPWKRVRLLQLNENTPTFKCKDYDLISMLMNEYKYKLIFSFYYMQVFWYRNKDCQVSLIFVHKPKHLAFMSYALFGKGSRGHFSRMEFAVHLNQAVTNEMLALAYDSVKTGQFGNARVDRKIFNGSALGAELFRIYFIRDVHLDVEASSLLAKAVFLWYIEPRIYPMMRDTMKWKKGLTRQEQNKRRDRHEGTRDELSRLVRMKIAHCLTTTKLDRTTYLTNALEWLITESGNVRIEKEKGSLDKIIQNMGEFVDQSIVDELGAIRDARDAAKDAKRKTTKEERWKKEEEEARKRYKANNPDSSDSDSDSSDSDSDSSDSSSAESSSDSDSDSSDSDEK